MMAQLENHRAPARWPTEGTVGEWAPARRGANRTVRQGTLLTLTGVRRTVRHPRGAWRLRTANSSASCRPDGDRPETNGLGGAERMTEMGRRGSLRARGRDTETGRDEPAEKSAAARTQRDGRGASGTRESGAVGCERGSGWAWSQTDRRHGRVAQDKQVKKSDVVSPRWRNRAEARQGGWSGHTPVTQTSPSAKSCLLSLEGAAVTRWGPQKHWAHAAPPAQAESDPLPHSGPLGWSHPAPRGPPHPARGTTHVHDGDATPKHRWTPSLAPHPSRPRPLPTCAI